MDENLTDISGHFDNPFLTLNDDSNFSLTLQTTPISNFTLCPSVEMPLSNLLFMLLYTVVCVVGLMGNTLVIYVVLRFSNMQTVTNMYILNLAIADECFLIGIPFLITTMRIGHWSFGGAMCKAYMVSTSITQFTSSIFLFIMSADRYIAICHHISSPKYRTPLVSRVVSALAWIASAIIMLPIMLYANTVRNKLGKYSCTIEWPENYGHMPGFSFIVYSLILGFVIPLIFIMTFYCLVIKKLRNIGPKANKSRSKRRSHRKVTKLVLTVITVYILCWLPYWISQVALISSPPESCSTRLEITIFLLVGCLGYSNSAINPILYAYLSENFKKSFVKACQCAAGKDVNAQLRLENSVLPRKPRNRQNSETLPSGTSKSQHRLLIDQTTVTATTTTTLASTVSSRNPSPPNHRHNPAALNHNNNNNDTSADHNELAKPLKESTDDTEENSKNGEVDDLVQFA